MNARILVIPMAAFLTLAVSACTTAPAPELSPQLCDFVITSDVDGVKIENQLVGTVQSVAGEEHRFALPCTEQTFALSKPCYDSLQISLTPEHTSEYRLSAEDWLHHGYLRVENDSTSEPLEVGGLPKAILKIASHEHGVRKLPLGGYGLELSAPYKVPLAHEMRLCTEGEIFSLRVQTMGPENRLTAQGAQELTLEHGMGQLRVVTEVSNVTFRIKPSTKQTPSDFRLWRLPSTSYRAPALIELPAGRYSLHHSRAGDVGKEKEVTIGPNSVTQVALP